MMTRVTRSLTTLALLVGLALPARADVNLTGTWTVHTDVVPGSFTWELQQSGATLSTSFLGGTINAATGEFLLYPLDALPCQQVLIGQARADGNAFSGVIRDAVMSCPGGIGTCGCDIGPNVIGAVNGCRDGAGACCGDAVVDAGEACDDGPQGSGSCCDGTCAIATGQACTSDADVCTADVCDAGGTCQHLPEPDTDGDGTCDPLDVCPAGVAFGRAKMRLGRFTTPEGDDRVQVKGEMAVAPPPNPVAEGLRLQIARGDGSLALDAMIPSGAWEPAQGAGWKANAAGTTFTFRGPAARVKLAAVKSTPGRWKLDVTLLDQALAAVAAPVAVTVILTPFVVPAAQCGQTTFASCTAAGGGATLRCR